MSGFKWVFEVKSLAASKALFEKVLKTATNILLQEGVYALERSLFAWKDLVNRGVLGSPWLAAKHHAADP